MSEENGSSVNWAEVAVTAGICLAIVAGVLAIPQVRAYLATTKPAA